MVVAGSADAVDEGEVASALGSSAGCPHETKSTVAEMRIVRTVVLIIAMTMAAQPLVPDDGICKTRKSPRPRG